MCLRELIVPRRATPAGQSQSRGGSQGPQVVPESVEHRVLEPYSGQRRDKK